MRVISGKARGKALVAPEGLHTRPVTDAIKEAIFNTIQFRVYDSNFLDLFSGSGSMGIEAISRGAKKAIMVDNDQNAIDIINKNITNCKFNKDEYLVLKDDVFNVIKDLDNKNERFDIIYLDPPYTVESIFIPVMEALGNSKLLKEEGILAIRSHVDKKLNDEFGCLVKTREKKYGISMVHYYVVK